MTKAEYLELLIKSATDGTFPSYKDKKCRYRLGTKKCAVGLLIPYEKYSKEIEGLCCSHIINIIDMPSGLTNFQLAVIQCIHDRHAPNWDADKFIKDINLSFSKML